VKTYGGIVQLSGFVDSQDQSRRAEELTRSVGGVSRLMNGLALIAQVQIDYPAIRSIVVSGDTSAEQAGNAGAFGFVAKPYLAKTIVQAARDTASRH